MSMESYSEQVVQNTPTSRNHLKLKDASSVRCASCSASWTARKLVKPYQDSNSKTLTLHQGVVDHRSVSDTVESENDSDFFNLNLAFDGHNIMRCLDIRSICSPTRIGP